MNTESGQFVQPPTDPQHPPDLMASNTSPYYPQPATGGHPPYPYQQYPQNNWGYNQPQMGMVAPELDPAVDLTNLDRKTAAYVQRETAKWVKESKYSLGKEESRPLFNPVKNLFLATITGTFIGKYALSQFAPSLIQGSSSKPWMMGALLFGYPCGAIATYFSAIPSTKAILEGRSPLSVQARYFYRVSQAEKNNLPIPPPPFQPSIQYPGMPATSPWGPQGQNQPHPQALQWNTFQPQPQYPPPMPPGQQQWGGGSDSNQKDPRYRSWEDIRGSTTTDQNSIPNQSHPDEIA